MQEMVSVFQSTTGDVSDWRLVLRFREPDDNISPAKSAGLSGS